GAALYAASIVARRRRNRASATVLGLAGMGAMTLGGYLGGHLTLVRGVGVNRTLMEDPPKDWTATLADLELADRSPHVADVDDIAILVYRTGHNRYALSNTCTHAGGPLNEGDFDDSNPAGPCVKCPWHQSVFDLRDGSVVHGPAAVPQPAYDVRVADGTIEVRPR
ncbi:MAG: Rieske (2Fe-2S) protein, partial [Ilumatobacteraceae bacterium]